MRGHLHIDLIKLVILNCCIWSLILHCTHPGTDLHRKDSEIDKGSWLWWRIVGRICVRKECNYCAVIYRNKLHTVFVYLLVGICLMMTLKFSFRISFSVSFWLTHTPLAGLSVSERIKTCKPFTCSQMEAAIWRKLYNPWFVSLSYTYPLTWYSWYCS